ncbi:MAG TPA: TIGR00725 family protein [Actinobacteria bacterium]|nr:TIGR00725 family protein [Actinomycetota bacterium]
MTEKVILPRIDKKIIKIAVIGGAECSEEIYQEAYKVGYGIGSNSAVLINGGLYGVMEASARGAKDSGGMTIGILPAESEDTANPYIDIKITTGMGYARNAIIIKSAHAVIAVDGGFGTLSEIGYTLSYNKPLIAYNTWTLLPCSKQYEPLMHYAKSADEAVSLAIGFATGKNI